jgi:hypothetical protein
VNCNLFLDGAPVFKPCLTIKRPWGQVLVTSAASPERIREYVPDSLWPGLEIKDPLKALIETIEINSLNGQPVVIISFLNRQEEDLLLKRWDRQLPLLLLRTGEKSMIDSASSGENMTVIDLGSGGRCMGAAEFHQVAGNFTTALEVLDSTHREDAGLKRKIDLFYRTRGLYQRMPDLQQAHEPPTEKTGKPGKKSKLLTLYYSPECQDCLVLIDRHLKSAVQKGSLVLKMVDITAPENYLKLEDAQRALGRMTKNMPVARFEGALYDGKEEIVEKLLPRFK